MKKLCVLFSLNRMFPLIENPFINKKNNKFLHLNLKALALRIILEKECYEENQRIQKVI